MSATHRPGSTAYIGQPIRRVDGPAKVTGAARYAAEYAVPGLAHGYVVSSPIAKGRIAQINAQPVLALPGVLAVFSHENVPALARFDFAYKDHDAPPGSPFRPLHSAEIKFSQQPVALVVAETFEQARYAASVLEIKYEVAAPTTDLRAELPHAHHLKGTKLGFELPKPRGDFAAAFAAAPFRVEAEYTHAAEFHNPLEPFATTVEYHAPGQLTVYDKTQGVLNSQGYVAGVFGLKKKHVRVVNPYMGGGFGAGLRPQYQLFMAVLAATQLRRSVRVVLTRAQLFSFGHRPEAVQRVALAASPDGRLQAVRHVAYTETSRFEEYIEAIVSWSGLLYQCANVLLDQQLVDLDRATPLDMRAPGAATGVIALECALDELAHQLQLDPLAFRLLNYAERDQNHDKPFSSKELRECYRQGAARFGWAARPLAPRTLRRHGRLVGWGMASGVWESTQFPARAQACLTAAGRLTVGSAAADIGTGTFTIMTQIAAETLGLPLDHVTFQLGDSDLPFSLFAGGSAMAGSVGSAVQAVCQDLGRQLLKLAQKLPSSPLAGASFAHVRFCGGELQLAADPSRAVAITHILAASGVPELTEKHFALPNIWRKRKFAQNVHSAVFVEVEVDEDLGTIHVTRVVSAVAGGRILNAQTARSQLLGGVVWGIGQALHEAAHYHPALGRVVNHSLAEYHLPVNADIPAIDVIFVDEHDDVVNPLGAKGLGEIGIVGTAAAVANAIFHATGRRVREFPITLDKLL